MCDNTRSNPFAGLFFSPTDTFTNSPSTSPENTSSIQATTSADSPNDLSATKDANEEPEIDTQDESETPFTDATVTTLLREAFGISLNPESKINKDGRREQFVLLEAETVEDAIFERLLLSDVSSRLHPKSDNSKGLFCQEHTVDQNIISYLAESYAKLTIYEKKKGFEKSATNLMRITLRNVGTVLQEPEVFPQQEIYEQVVRFFDVQQPYTIPFDITAFLIGVIDELPSQEGQTKPDQEIVTTAFGPVLDVIRKDAQSRNLMNFRPLWFALLTKFATIEPLAKLILQNSAVENNLGASYGNTLLGVLFTMSTLPKKTGDPYDFFEENFNFASGYTQSDRITPPMNAAESLADSLHRVFHALLKCSPEVNHMTLNWISGCLEANAARGKLWNRENNVDGGTTVSDGFMMNFGAVMLRLCEPFLFKRSRSYNIEKLNVDPTYCAAEAKDESERLSRGLHMKGLTSETCLIPTPEGETRPSAASYGFTTECFFLTHRALDLGFRIVCDKLFRAYQDLARTENLHNEAMASGSGASGVLEVIAQRIKMETDKLLCLQASVLPSNTVFLMFRLYVTTASWLLQVIVDVNHDENSTRKSYVPQKFKEVTFPLPDNVPATLRCIPEFIVENTVELLCFLKRLSPQCFEMRGADAFLYPILTEIIALMESPRRLYNPHLRARLAEGLEALLPTTKEAPGGGWSHHGCVEREMLFHYHPHRHQLVANLLEVFVSIEMTGQSVQFEQKFNYRRPMYTVMEHLWKLPEHRQIFKNHAEIAEKNIEAMQPPIFLRFVNLLMNDAVFLLDEALSNMAQLKQLFQARDSGEWKNLPRHERDQQMSHLVHIGMLARFDNILGRKTIKMLNMLTTEITSIFCHSTMVDRIASMLNYLLLQLVGPNQRNLKVKDQQEYDFNPANLVLNICEIYINLGKNEKFTLAVSQDGRSYSSELFNLAERVLVKIGGVGILSDLDDFAKRVQAAANIKKEEDEILNDAPEEFLDPIMSTLMSDPVILPSSKITVDRQTISRHLLSDQTDPFNRSPLTMDMIKSNTELRGQVEDWIKQKRLEKSSISQNEQAS